MAGGVRVSWGQVWESRRLNPAVGSELAQLMALDGLDTEFSGVSEASWVRFVNRVAHSLELGPGTSVFDVGCGAGAFLYELRRMGCVIGGIDSSKTLVEYARTFLGGDRFEVAEAQQLSLSPPADVVLSCAAFLYFPSQVYAGRVMAQMVGKARRAVAILDLPDRALRQKALQFRWRSSGGRDSYEARYAGLDHLYFDRDWVRATLAWLGLVNIHVADQKIDGYGNAPFRFNAWGFRRSAGVNS